MFTVIKVTSIWDDGQAVCDFATKEAAHAYRAKLSEIEAVEMCDTYWYEVVDAEGFAV